ncbi:MAG: T9SS type A sorting domain-containing protein [Bacteroidales bacterium]|jgi:hypothetical protein|nr:T9SS type A sorting domain-containing protein [Bacteroidales bacterium]
MKLIPFYLSCLFLIILAATPVLQAQRYMEWSKQASHYGKLNVSALTTHKPNIYVAGHFNDSLLLGNTTLKSEGSEDIFLVKYRNNGSLQWATNKGNKGQASVLASTILATGNHIILGGTTTAIPFYHKQTDIISKALFLSVWDTSGFELWQKTIPFDGMASLDMLASGPDSTILVGGMFKGSISLTEDQHSTKENTAFFAQLSDQGELLESAISTGSGQHRTIAATRMANGSILLMFAATKGHFQFKGTEIDLTYPMESDGLLIFSLTPSFEKSWVAAIRSEGFVEGVKLLGDYSSTTIAAINFNGKLTCNEQQIQTTAQLATILLRFDEDGNLINYQLISNNEYCRLKDIAVMPDNNLMLTGYFSGITMFGESFAGSSKRQAFVAQLSDNDRLIWYDILHLGDNHIGQAVSLGSEADVFIGGDYQMYAANTTGIVNKSTRQNGFFLNKYKNCKPLPLKITAPPMMCLDDTLTITATPGYAFYDWTNSNTNSNTLMVTEPGKYGLLVIDENGCKASDTIQIKAAPITSFDFGDEVVLSPGESLELVVDSTFSSYSWSDNYQGRNRLLSYHQNEESLLLGLTVQSEGHCPTSDTLLVKFTENKLLTSFNVYPVPAKNILYWTWTGQEQILYDISIIDTHGAVMFEKKLGIHTTSFSAHLKLDNLKSGAYTIRLHTSEGILNRLIVKQ